MLVTINQIVTSQETLKKLTSQDLPISDAISLLKVCKATSTHMEAFQKKQLSLFEKFGTKTEDESQWVVGEENKPAYFAALQKVIETEVELEFDKVDPLVLTAAGIKLSVNDISTIEWLLA